MRKSTLRALATVVMAVAALHISHAEQARVAALAALLTTPSATPRPTYTPTITPTPGPSPTPTPHVSAVVKMEAAVDEFCRLKSFSGVVLVMREGQTILERACGLSDRNQERPKTIDTRFLVGSLAAEFNAAALLLLEQDGRLALSDPLCGYLADCPAECRDCTIEGLFLAGSLRPGALGSAPKPANTRPGWPDSRVLGLAAQLIERLSGLPYESFLRNRVFAPLQMDSTGVVIAGSTVAAGYRGAYSAPEPPPEDPAPFLLYSTVDDLRRWDAALSESVLLDAVAVSQLYAPHRPDTALTGCLAQLAPPTATDAGAAPAAIALGQSLGGTVLLEDGHHLVRAEGQAPGYRALHLRYDKDGITVITLSNQGDSLDIAAGLRDLALSWETPVG